MSKQKNPLDPYKDVVLTQEEIDAALYEAKRVKGARIAMEAYKQKLKVEAAYPKYTYEQYIKLLKKEGVVIDEWNKEIIDQLIYYFIGDKLKFNGSFEKGIFIQGPIGCGKSSIMEFFRKNQTNCFNLISCRDIAYKFAILGYNEITRYNHPVKVSARNEWFGQEIIGTCFDDLGTENDKAKNFGNSENVMLQILLNRYDQKIFKLTHITTNLIPEEIEAQYDARLRSRLREMCNVLVFHEDAPDRRK